MKNVARYIWVLLALLSARSACANDVERVLSLWSAQSGPWSGEIEIFGRDGKKAQTSGLQTTWIAVPSKDKMTVTKLETFVMSTGELRSITLMFSDPLEGLIKTPYFVNGKQQDFLFAVKSVSQTDETHWTTVIESPHGSEVYENRPAVLRYVRTRNADRIENTKEVNFLDDDKDVYELRSLIRQTLSSSNK